MKHDSMYSMDGLSPVLIQHLFSQLLSTVILQYSVNTQDHSNHPGMESFNSAPAHNYLVAGCDLHGRDPLLSV